MKTILVSEHVKIEEGSFIGKCAILNLDIIIGKMCIINSGVIAEHDCQVDDFSHIFVGNALCGGVYIGRDPLPELTRQLFREDYGEEVYDRCRNNY